MWLLGWWPLDWWTFGDHLPSELFAWGRRQGCAGNRRGDSQRLGVTQVRIDGSDHDAGLNRDQIDSYQGDPDPCIDDDALVEDAVKDVDETGAAWGSFNGGHAVDYLFRGRERADGADGGGDWVSASRRSSSAMRCSRRAMTVSVSSCATRDRS